MKIRQLMSRLKRGEEITFAVDPAGTGLAVLQVRNKVNGAHIKFDQANLPSESILAQAVQDGLYKLREQERGLSKD